MAVVKEIYMSKICSLIAFVYLGYIGSSLAWADHHCPSEDKETHECYELTIEPRTCVSYGIQCCSNTYNGYFCQLCLKEEYRPCPLYMCTNRGCCKGWAEDEFGQCSIPTGSEIICENGGVLYGNSSMCRCPQSFSGDRCEITVCEVNCQNGGTCAMVEEEPTCICPSSYFSGNFCEIEHQHATAAIQQSKSFQNCRISMAVSSQEAVETSMMNTYFTDKRDIAGSLVPQLNMLNGDK